MIRRGTDLTTAERRLREVSVAALTLQAELVAAGVEGAALDLAMRDKVQEQERLRQDIERYKRLRDSSVAPHWKLAELPVLFFALRTRLNMTQREFAGLLGIPGANLSRDEHTDYENISFARMVRCLDRLGLDVAATVVPRPSSPMALAFAPDATTTREPQGQGEESTLEEEWKEQSTAG